MSYSKEIYNAFADFFQQNGLKYDFEQNQERFCLDIPVKCRLKSVKLYVALYDTRYSVYAMMPYHADREERPRVVDFLKRMCGTAKCASAWKWTVTDAALPFP